MTISPVMAACLYLCSLSLFAQQQQADTVKETPVHQTAQISSAVIERLPADTAIAIMQRHRAWYQISQQNTLSGWVKMLNVRFATSPKRAGEVGIGQLLQSVSGGRSTESTGIRGFDAESLSNSVPNPAAVLLLDGFVTTPTQQQAFIKQGQLNGATP
ncbi:hypothetical protein PULV_b0174 [Pseudoalteromonas ulvae UL12]|uniref:SH3 domain-containing protein n=1 Tax=Pseudoalteromonas ulvae TaxID=107327 RepID=UPI00186B6521|nr:SH3 domain-containing protein [Pseudoalteromonas ulvae]MBE0365574.1 hypothetical protein [Pseudoalteromonas ulvae UL12]